jgi:hypothetical protein
VSASKTSWRLVPRDESLVCHVHGDADLGFGGTLAVPGLQEPELAPLDGELHVLHVAVVRLELAGDVHELVEESRRSLLELFDGVGGADSCHDVLALGAFQVVSLEDRLSRRPVPGHAHAGGRALAEVAEDHGLDVDGGSQVVGNARGVPVVDGPLAVPRAEHGLRGTTQLLPGVSREVVARERPDHAPVRFDHREPVVRVQSRVRRHPRLGAAPVQDVLEMVVRDVENDATEHVQEATVEVVREAGVAGGAGEPGRDLVVQPQVEDRVHHPRHGELGARPAREQEGILRIPESLPRGLLERGQRLHLLFPESFGE